MTKSKENTSKDFHKPEVVDDFVVEFRKYRTELTEKFKNRSNWKPVDPSKVLSFIPGTITKVFVKAGDVVEPGTELMVLEAMKMKNKVVFHKEAVVKSIMVKEGEKVPKNHVMIEFE